MFPSLLQDAGAEYLGAALFAATAAAFTAARAAWRRRRNGKSGTEK